MGDNMVVRTLFTQSAPKIVNEFCDELKLAETSKDYIHAVHLGGAHAKGLANKNSDFDIRVYYQRPLSEILSLRPKGLTFNKEFSKLIHTREGNTFMEWKGKEFELIFIPLFSVSAPKQLFRSLLDQNGDMIYKLFTGINVFESHEFTDFMKDLRFQFLFEQYRPKGFFLGYMTSQAMKHQYKKGDDRARDYARAVRKATETGSVSPVVKQIIEAVNIGLQGVSFLTKQTFIGDFNVLLTEYSKLFHPSDYKFIIKCYSHKIDKKHIPTSPEFFTESEMVREGVFNTLSIYLKHLDSSLPEKLTPSQERKNNLFLTRKIHELYKGNLVCWPTFPNLR